jgi:hypothetical protein
MLLYSTSFDDRRLTLYNITLLYSMAGSRHILPAQGIFVDSTEYMYKQLV